MNWSRDTTPPPSAYSAVFQAIAWMEMTSVRKSLFEFTAGSEGTNFNQNFRRGFIVQNLPQKQKTVLTLRVFQELRFKQIAAILDMTENNAKVNYHHAVKKLKETIGEE